MPTPLPPGLYEHLLTQALAAAADDHRAQGWLVDVDPCDPALVPELLARGLYAHARRALMSVRGKEEERIEGQIALANGVLEALRQAGERQAVLAEDAVRPGGKLLREVRPPSPSAIAEPKSTRRPHLSLSRSGLLVNAHRDFQIGGELGREIASADRIDLLCAFVRFAGLRLVRREIEQFIQRGGTLRVIASVYTGSTEKRALDELVELGAQVKVSYETAQTRLHAKAWQFHRATGLSTAYIGSSNLTHTALVDGLEWNVRVSQADNPDIVERVGATFEQYWHESEFVAYEPARDGDKLTRALAEQRGGGGVSPLESLIALNLELSPKPHQADMLEALAVERSHGHRRNLVVAATGTGKTWVSAFDYERLRRDRGVETLLFVAHRDEILRQSQQVFQLVLGEPAFGERFIGGERPVAGSHVFASIQSLSRHVGAIDPKAFDLLIVDEFHHAAAPTYERLLARLEPAYVVGLTATPERADGQSVLSWFDGRTACEIRLWQALEQGLLCPFHYFGIHDGTDLSSVKFRRGRYVAAELENVYTADDARVTRIRQAVSRYVLDPGAMRALGFCVGVGHAELMAERFTEANLPSVALHADSPKSERREAVERLRRGEIRVIFTVDLFNEGVDIPEVDTVLMLRPTESATVFLQQLGRGLRWAREKSVLTVLDFVGQAHREFRFDVRYRALIGGTRRQIASAVKDGFPLLPPGCAIQLDRLAQDHVLRNIEQSIRGARRALLDDLRAVGPEAGLGAFLRAGDYDLEDVYARPGARNSFTSLRRDVGFEKGEAAATENGLCSALGRMLHVDDDERLETWRRWLAADRPPEVAPADAREGRLQLMLFAALGHRRRPIAELGAALDELWATAPVRRELSELLELLGDRIRSHARSLSPDEAMPLASHATYGLFEVMAAFAVTGGKGSLVQLQTGVYWAKEAKTDLLFITLEKSDAEYSPTTRYEDYPLSPTQFHWESQNVTASSSPTGRRYVEHGTGGTRAILFVRERKKDGRGVTSPYVCLGYGRYVRHESERPMRIVWELERAMPAWLYQAGKVAAG